VSASKLITKKNGQLSVKEQLFCSKLPNMHAAFFITIPGEQTNNSYRVKMVKDIPPKKYRMVSFPYTSVKKYCSIVDYSK
jgi:hypothetical protein